MRNAFAIVFFAGLTMLCYCVIHVVMRSAEIETDLVGLVLGHIFVCAGYLGLMFATAEIKRSR